MNINEYVPVKCELCDGTGRNGHSGLCSKCRGKGTYMKAVESIDRQLLHEIRELRNELVLLNQNLNILTNTTMELEHTMRTN